MPFPKTGGVQGEEEFGKRQAAQGLGDDGRRGAMGLDTLVARKAPEAPLPALGLQGRIDGMGNPGSEGDPHAVDHSGEHVGEALGVTVIAPLIEAGHCQQGPVESVSFEHGVASFVWDLRFAPSEGTPCS